MRCRTSIDRDSSRLIDRFGGTRSPASRLARRGSCSMNSILPCPVSTTGLFRTRLSIRPVHRAFCRFFPCRRGPALREPRGLFALVLCIGCVVFRLVHAFVSVVDIRDGIVRTRHRVLSRTKASIQSRAQILAYAIASSRVSNPARSPLMKIWPSLPFSAGMVIRAWAMNSPSARRGWDRCRK